MRTFLQLCMSLAITVSCLMSNDLQAQIMADTKLMTLPEGTKMAMKESFGIPVGAKSVLLDNGKGKICSCQFFTATAQDEIQLYDSKHLFSLRKVTIKGLFDGSQMHVARIYFENTSDYFKLKCYTRDILVKHVSDYLTIGAPMTIREN